MTSTSAFWFCTDHFAPCVCLCVSSVQSVCTCKLQMYVFFAQVLLSDLVFFACVAYVPPYAPVPLSPALAPHNPLIIASSRYPRATSHQTASRQHTASEYASYYRWYRSFQRLAPSALSSSELLRAHASSNRSAEAPPPPLQMPATPNLPPFCLPPWGGAGRGEETPCTQHYRAWAWTWQLV